MTDEAPKEKDKPKIVVDDTWKAQAQAEKERLAKEAETAKPATPPQAGKAGAEADRRERELPPADFATLVSTLVTQIFLALGGYEDPKTKRRYVDLALARHHIDMLTVLEEKTRGNLTPQEKTLLDKALYETRMQYVQLAQRL
jgi:hypothetical protein